MTKPEPYPFKSADGTDWEVFDLAVRERRDGTYQRTWLELGSDRAMYRVFKSDHRAVCFRFGSTSDRDARPCVLEAQLQQAIDIRAAGGVARR